MAAANATLMVPIPNYDVYQLNADIDRMSNKKLRDLHVGSRVAVLVEEHGVRREVGFNRVPFEALKAACPVVKRVAAGSNLQTITTVVLSLPEDGVKEVLGLLQSTVINGKRQNLPHPEETPLYTYNQIGEVAHALGMNRFADLTVVRANRILDRDLRDRVVDISAADVRAIYGNLGPDHTLRQAISSSIARGIVSRRITKSKELKEVEREIAEFKQELKLRKQAWSMKKKGGEDIRIPSDTY